MSIYKKLLEVQKEIGAISKDSTNPFFKSKYFDINKLIEHVNPLLSNNDLVLIQPIIDGCQVSKIIDIESGDSVESMLPLSDIKDPQKKGSEITYFRRYTLGSLLALQAEDDDATAASKEVKELPWLNPDDPKWEEVKTKLANGTKMETVLQHFKISTDNKKRLIE